MENSTVVTPVYKVNFVNNNIGETISKEETNRLGQEYVEKTPVLILVYKMNSKGKSVGIVGIWSNVKILEYTWLYDEIYML